MHEKTLCLCKTSSILNPETPLLKQGDGISLAEILAETQMNGFRKNIDLKAKNTFHLLGML